MNQARDLDVIVFGATGFTGGLVSEYLATKRELPVSRWAIAGRSRTKLEAVRQRLIAIDPALTDLHIIEASSDDAPSLEAMASRTRVVLTTVGPYIRYGEPLVRACVASGTHYVDITGEPEFVNAIEDAFDDEAKNKKLKIVNCCGFDSIPHDLGVLYTVRQLEPKDDMSVEGFVRSNGTISGGTWNSAVDAMARFRAHRKASAKRKARRTPSDGRRVGSTKMSARYEKAMKRWVAPLPTIDPEIVKKSARVLSDYGRNFRYGHYLTVRSLPQLLGLGAAVGGAFAVAQIPPGAALLRKFKAPGDGPTDEERARSKFSVTFLAEADGKKITTRVSGGDPGYTETSKMVAESALCLALDADLPEHYGITTTAAAMGDRLIERLRSAGMVFETLG